jgi:ribonuclease HI/pterin-4a-carbinolamine dehydratase
MWKEKEGKLHKKFTFDDFAQAFSFMAEVAEVAEEQGHHPEWKNVYNTVEFWLKTHDEDTITDKDKQLAQAIDDIANNYSNDKAADTKSEKKPEATELILYADGGSRGNPGPSASGYVLMNEEEQVLQQSGEYLGITTNNQAEYHAVRLGLEKAKALGAKEVDVYLDSLLVVNQMRGKFKVKNRDLWPIHQAVKDLVAQFDKVTFTHVPREMNKAADAEVNKVLDARHEK